MTSIGRGAFPFVPWWAPMSPTGQAQDDTAGPPPDSRKHPRFTVDVEARVKLGAGTAVQARTRDVSRAGICLITSEALSAGVVLSMELVLAFGNDAFSEPLHLPAKVVWCTQIGGAYQVGAIFDEMTEEQENFLEMFLQFLDGTLSPRGEDETGGDGDDTNELPDDVGKDDPFR